MLSVNFMLIINYVMMISISLELFNIFCQINVALLLAVLCGLAPFALTIQTPFIMLSEVALCSENQYISEVVSFILPY